MKKLIAEIAIMVLLASCASLGSGVVTVNFNSNGGGEVPPQTLTKGEKITQPDLPDRDGLEFGGWFRDDKFTDIWLFNRHTVSRNMRLHARWVPVSPPHYTVSGQSILDPDGNLFVAKGVNVNGPGWVWPRDTVADVGLIADVWKFNLVRVNIALGWTWARNNNADLDAIIDAFNAKGVVTMIEVHDFIGTYPEEKARFIENGVKRLPSQSELVKWWVDKAKLYQNNPYVWFNIINEPGRVWEEISHKNQAGIDLWENVHDEVIEAIRATGAKNIIVLDEHLWAQAEGYHNGPHSWDSAVIRKGAQLNAKYDNLVYSLHVYGWWADGEQRFRFYFMDAAERGLCVLVGEYGNATPEERDATRHMFNYAIPNNIGRVWWAWDDPKFKLTDEDEGMGWKIDRTDGAMPSNLSEEGRMVWLDNRGELTAPVN